MISKKRLEESKHFEDVVESYLIKNNIRFKREEQLISKLRPDFLLENNIILECKYIDDSTSTQSDPTSERTVIFGASFTQQILDKFYYDKNFKTIVIAKRKSGRYSPSSIIYGNIIFELLLPFEYINYLDCYLRKTKSKEEIFFLILDDLFNKFWKKTRTAGSFPTIAYHLLLDIEKYGCVNVTNFIKRKDYTASSQNAMYRYLTILELLGIISKTKHGCYVDVKLNTNRWRYFVYLDMLSKGSFRKINQKYAQDLWNRIIKAFNV